MRGVAPEFALLWMRRACRTGTWVLEYPGINAKNVVRAAGVQRVFPVPSYLDFFARDLLLPRPTAGYFFAPSLIATVAQALRQYFDFFRDSNTQNRQ